MMLSMLFLASCAETKLAAHMATVGHAGEPGHYKVGKPYQIRGVWYRPKEDFAYDQVGVASWYGPGFHGKTTANGERFDETLLTAAHPTLQLPSIVRVTNLENGRSIIVRVNDRGPFVGRRIIDLSRRSAELLGFREQGVARVRVQVLADESRQVALVAGRDPFPETGPRTPQPTFVAASAPVPVGEVVRPDRRPEPTPEPAPRRTVREAPRPSAPGGVFVQAGAFTDYGNAVGLRDELQPLGAARIESARVEGAQFHRVRLGPLASEQEAYRMLARLVNAGHAEARIVRR